MGASVSSRVEYDENGYLDYSPRNKDLLEDLVKYVQEMGNKHPRESAVVFDRNFHWCTVSRAADFRKLPNSDELFVFTGDDVASVAKTRSGDPCMILSKLGSIFEIRCWNFAALNSALATVEDKVAEAKLCLESNTDPLTSIMGPGYVNMGTASSLLATHERLQRERERSSSENAQELEDLDSKFRLCLILNSVDVKLLERTVKFLGREVRVSPEFIDREMELVRQYTGTSQLTSCIEAIEYTSDLLFANGCRAPPKRQAKGDICFIAVKSFDCADFTAGCNVTGFYVVKDMAADADPSLENDMFPSLISLIKVQSKHFGQHFGQEEFRRGHYKQKLTEMTDEDSISVTLEINRLRKTDPNSMLGPDACYLDPAASPLSTALPSLAGDVKSPDKGSGPVSAKPAPPGGKDRGVVKTESSKDTEMSGRGISRGTADSKPGVKAAGKKVKKSSVLAGIEKGMAKAKHEKKVEDKKTYVFGKEMVLSEFHEIVETGVAAVEKKEREEKEKKERQSLIFGERRSRDLESRQRNLPPSLPMDEDFASGASSADEEEDENDKFIQPDNFAELPTDYWGLQKMIKYIKGGDLNATVIALCSMVDFALASASSQLALKDNGGVEVLVNLLGVDDEDIKMGSLRILKEISICRYMRLAITDYKGIPLIVQLMDSENYELAAMAAETLARIAAFSNARHELRRYGAMRKFTKLLHHEKYEVNKAGALGLWRCSKSTKNKSAIYHAQSFAELAKLLHTDNEELLIPVVGTIQECSIQSRFQELIRIEGMVPGLVRLFSSQNQELQSLSANSVFRSAQHADVRRLVRESGGLPPLTKMLAEAKSPGIVTSVTGALWKCAVDRESVNVLRDCKATDHLVALLNRQPEEVLLNVTGALGYLAQDAENRTTIRKAGGIVPLVHLLTGTNDSLLINVTMTIKHLAADPECVQVIDKQDGIRFLWSLLKSNDEQVKSCALLALCPCMEKTKEAGEMVRSFVGGLELVINLLKSDSIEVLSNVCALIGCIALDEENLAVITDHNVVSMLSELANTNVDGLRLHLAEAIARCCAYSKNRESFGEFGAVAPLVNFLTSTVDGVRQSTCRALYQLSRDPNNCITLHKQGVVQPLLKLMGSKDEAIQENAACCIRNIRLLALANERPDMVKPTTKERDILQF